MRKGRFTILEEDPTIYPHTHLCPVIYMGESVVTMGNAMVSLCQHGQEVVGMTVMQKPSNVELPLC
jgi:hypothetical protein